MQAAILAGGEGRRFFGDMGGDKSGLIIGGVPIIHREIQILRPIFPRIVVVCPAVPASWGLPEGIEVIGDSWPGKGPLGGIHAALSRDRGWWFIVAGDMPFLCPDLVSALIGQDRNGLAVVPKWRKGMEPLHALYHSDCVRSIEDLGGMPCPRVRDLFALVPTEYFECEGRGYDLERAFANVNTRRDLDRLMYESI